MKIRAITAALITSAALVGIGGTTAATPVNFTEEFAQAIPLGSFDDCNHQVDTPGAYCARLPTPYRGNWWAYPTGWPDTATQRGYPVGGRYDPARTLWVSDGQLHIRMFREGSGPVHSAAVVPKPLMTHTYGTYEERFRVSRVATGYKSAHLLWPTGGPPCAECEIDFPEAEWDGRIHAFTHQKGGGQQDSFSTGAVWSDWHVSRIEWRPGVVRYYLDGRLIGTSTRGVPDQPMSWIIQNEAALDRNSAAPGSWAQMDIDWVRGSAS